MKRFSKREQVMMIVLGLIVLGAAYYFTVFVPLQDRITESEKRVAAAQDAIVVEQGRMRTYSKMKKEIKAKQAAGAAVLRPIPDYNNLNMVMIELNGIMSTATTFDIDFPEVDLTKKTISRTVSISFTAPNYAGAKQVIQNLSDCYYRCTVNAVDMAAKQEKGNTEDEIKDIRTQNVSATVDVVFHEINKNFVPPPVETEEGAAEEEGA